MIVIIYAGLLILPLGLLIFGSIFLKRKFTNLNVPVILSVGIVVIICEFLFFNSQYSEAIDHKLWNAVGSVISFFPLFVSLTMIAVCILVYCLTEIFKFKNKKHFVKLALVISILILTGRIYILKNHDSEFLKTITMLSKSDCPEAVLRAHADMNNIDYQLAIIANKNSPKDLILKLSHSENEMVRFYSTSSPQLSIERLLEMKSNDLSKEVRKQAENELEFSRLIKNKL